MKETTKDWVRLILIIFFAGLIGVFLRYISKYLGATP